MIRIWQHMFYNFFYDTRILQRFSLDTTFLTAILIGRCSAVDDSPHEEKVEVVDVLDVVHDPRRPDAGLV